MTTEQTVRELLDGFGVPIPSEATERLEVPSLTMITLIEDLEAKFSFTVAAKEMRAENFGTLAALVAFVDRKRAR